MELCVEVLYENECFGEVNGDVSCGVTCRFLLVVKSYCLLVFG